MEDRRNERVIEKKSYLSLSFMSALCDHLKRTCVKVEDGRKVGCSGGFGTISQNNKTNREKICFGLKYLHCPL